MPQCSTHTNRGRNMARPQKLNETPTASFNLRETGPLPEVDIVTRLGGKAYRIAGGTDPDTRATVDRDPCPTCGALVEWAGTVKRMPPDNAPMRFVYARCRGKERHAWSFRSKPTPPRPSMPAPVIPPPRPSAGRAAIASWIDGQITRLQGEIVKLREIRRLAGEIYHAPLPYHVEGSDHPLQLTPPDPKMSPDGHRKH